MNYIKPNALYYRIAQAVCWVVSKAIFGNAVIRNEIRGKQGPFVVIANHECAYDFANLICATGRPMSFVISRSFFSSLPIKGFLEKMGVIPKQQFQTTVKDMKRMKSVIDHGAPLVIYPAGLMCEDGLSTPIPGATYKFLKWLGVDVYVARSVGSYFVMPKWTSGMRPGRTSIDIYKLFGAEELAGTSVEEVKQAVENALLFDAYREQENCPSRFWKNDDLRGLENVLYVCPHCGGEHTIFVENKSTLRCSQCGYSQQGDKFGFLHKTSTVGDEIRYVSDWSRLIYRRLKDQLRSDPDASLHSDCTFRMISDAKSRFVDAGSGAITLSRSGFHLTGHIHGEDVDFTVPVGNIPTLPFSPGKYLEIQHGNDIYRCVLTDGKLVMQFINMVKIFFELKNEVLAV